MRTPVEARIRVAAAAIATTAICSLVHGQAQSYESVNVCQRVPASAVAAAVSGRHLDERPVNFKGMMAARCVYGIEIEGTRRAFVVWLNPVGDFDELRKATDVPTTDVKGVGDEAFAKTDPESKRVHLTARVAGKVTVQVTGERMDWTQAIARAALSRF